MKIEKREGGKERLILTGLIVDRVVLAQIAGKWVKEGLFNSKWSNLVAGWCVKYFEKYDKPPGKAIEGLYDSWASGYGDKDSVRLVEKFLAGLSGEYEALDKESNSSYILDIAGEYFNQVKLARLAEAIQGDVDRGDLEKAKSRVDSFDQIEMGVGAGVDLTLDKAAIQQAFAAKRDPLIVYPQGLGHFFGDALERDAFIAFEGPEKRGKSFWLMDLAWRAMCQHRKVAFFEVGDMSQAQIMRRFMTRAAKRPMKPGKVFIPIDLEPGEPPEVTLKEYTYEKGLNWQTAWRAMKRITQKLDSKESVLKLSCYPSSTINVQGLVNVLKGWERMGWVPDVIVIDYADILAPPIGVIESRDQIDMTWKKLRGLAQSLHCLVVTATQTDAASYNTDVIDMGNFSGDKRKNAHVSGMVGLNATAEERKKGIMRLNWVAGREWEYDSDKCVYAAGCLGIGNPSMLSIF